MAEDYTGEAIISGIALTDSEVDLYTAERKIIISNIRFSLDSATEATVRMHIKAPGDSASVANNFIADAIVSPGIPGNYHERTSIPAGYTISAWSSVNGVISLWVTAAVSTT